MTAVPLGLAYVEAVTAALTEAALEQQTEIQRAGEAIATAVSGDHLVHVFGSGHSHMLAEELFYRAGGLAAVKPLLVPELMLHESAVASTQLERQPGQGAQLVRMAGLEPDDVMVVVSNSGRNPVPVEVAQAALDVGSTLVVVTSVQHAVSAGRFFPELPLLHELGHVVLDTGLPPGDALVTVPGGTRTGPGSTVVAAGLLNAVVVEATGLLAVTGPPPIFTSANSATGDRDNAELLARYHDRIAF